MQADALEFLEANAEWLRANAALVDASPPCQRYSATQRIWDRSHPDLIGPVREVLEWIGVPYVIENVEEARGELRDPVMLCGAPFGLRTYRHRLFETGGWTLVQPPHPEHTAPNAKMGRPAGRGEFRHYVGHFSGVQDARDDLSMPWASREGMAEAVPPAYTEWIGRQFLARLSEDLRAKG